VIGDSSRAGEGSEKEHKPKQVSRPRSVWAGRSSRSDGRSVSYRRRISLAWAPPSARDRSVASTAATPRRPGGSAAALNPRGRMSDRRTWTMSSTRPHLLLEAPELITATTTSARSSPNRRLGAGLSATPPLSSPRARRLRGSPTSRTLLVLADIAVEVNVRSLRRGGQRQTDGGRDLPTDHQPPPPTPRRVMATCWTYPSPTRSRTRIQRILGGPTRSRVRSLIATCPIAPPRSKNIALWPRADSAAFT